MSINTGQLKPAASAAISFHGHPVDEIISCLQKYIRRGLVDKALYTALDIDLFTQLYKLPPNQVLYTTKNGKEITAEMAKRFVKAKRTNLVNRLLVTMLEDIGPAVPSLIFEFEDLRKEWQKHREDEDQTLARIALVKMVILLATAKKKVRLVSDIKSSFFKRQAWDQIKKNKKWQKYYDLKGSQNLEENFKQALIDNDLSSTMYWMSKMFEKGDEVNEMLKIFKILKTHAKDKGDNNLFQALEILESSPYFKHFKKSRDKYILFLYPVVLSTLIQNLGWDYGKIDYESLNKVDVDFVKNLYQDHLNRDPLVLDDICIDIHTKAGKKMGKNVIDFVTTGSYIVDQDKDLLNQDWRDIYRFLKVIMPPPDGLGFNPETEKAQNLFEDLDIEYKPKTIKPKTTKIKTASASASEKDRFIDPVRAQLTCAGHRQDVYFAMDKSNNERVVVKGPFDIKKKNHLFAYNLNKIKKYLKDVNQMEMDIVQLKSDQWSKVPMGIRNKINSSGINDGYFMIMEDLCHDDKKLPKNFKIPTTKKSSKVWPETEVYDGKWVGNPCTSLDIPKLEKNENDELIIQAILAYIFRYIFEVTDTCDRNFLINWDEEKIYSIDEDNFGAGPRKYLTGNRPPPKKDNKNVILESWLNKYSDQLVEILTDWSKNLNKNQVKLAPLMEELGLDPNLKFVFNHLDNVVDKLEKDPKSLLI